MKRQTVFSFAILGILMFILSSCGGGGAGAPGTGGSGDTGVLINPELITFYSGIGYKFEQEKCEFTEMTGDPFNYNVDISSFGNHKALLVVRTSIINPQTTFQPGALYIEKYTIEYRRSTDAIGAPTIETYTAWKTIYVPVPTLDDLKKDPPVNLRCTLFPQPEIIFLDEARKKKYKEDVLSGRFAYTGNFINHYTAIYRFEGKNIHGKSFDFIVTRDFTIGDFTP